jgi:branched-chain amino acid aminotransferase
MDGVAFMRDGFVPFKDATVSIASSPVLYGLAVYTVFAVNLGKKGEKYAFRLKDHYDRLAASSKIMDFHTFTSEWPFEKFESTMRELISRNNVEERVLVRVSVFVDELIAGTKIHGLKHSLSAYVYPLGTILPREGIKVCVSSWRRTPDNSIPSRAKVNGGYVNVSLMKNEAILNGFDDALALDGEGHVCEGTVANFFLVRNGMLITPHAASDILEGITRNSIIALAEKEGLKVIERTIDRTELYVADEAFICGSSAGIIPVLSIDKRKIGSGKYPIISKLQKVYTEAQAGNVEGYTHWLTKL